MRRDSHDHILRRPSSKNGTSNQRKTATTKNLVTALHALYREETDTSRSGLRHCSTTSAPRDQSFLIVICSPLLTPTDPQGTIVGCIFTTVFSLQNPYRLFTQSYFTCLSHYNILFAPYWLLFYVGSVSSLERSRHFRHPWTIFNFVYPCKIERFLT